MSKTASVFCNIIISLWSIPEVESINFNPGNEVKSQITIKIENTYIQNAEQTYTYSIIIHTKQANYVSYTHIQRYSLDNYTHHYLYSIERERRVSSQSQQHLIHSKSPSS